jgi:hypothetical protein
MAYNVLHEVYRVDTHDNQDRNICKKVRGEECGNNYPSNSDTYRRCVDEVNWLCNRGYPKPNRDVKKLEELAKKIRLKIYNYLNQNNLKVNKKKFDEIMDAGLFTDLGNRMGNKVFNDKNVRAGLNEIFTEKDYYLGLIEGFGDDPVKKSNGVWWLVVILLICVVMIVGLILLCKKRLIFTQN